MLLSYLLTWQEQTAQWLLSAHMAMELRVVTILVVLYAMVSISVLLQALLPHSAFGFFIDINKLYCLCTYTFALYMQCQLSFALNCNFNTN